MPYHSLRFGRRAIIAPVLASVLSLAGSPQVHAAGPTAHLAIVDIHPLGDAYRASKMIGSTVMNDSNDKIGSIDDLLITPNERVLFAVLSVGGFLSVGRHLVVVPYSDLTLDEKGGKIILAGASKDALKNLPEFHYAK